MEYTVLALARIAGVSARTLRYYDEIHLLTPARQTEAGYRLYGAAQVERLQQILFYRELGFALEEIKELLEAEDFDGVRALREHRERLLARRDRLDALIRTVDRTLEASEGSILMSDTERFEGFKRELVAENERRYGAEVRERYGEEAAMASNRRVLDMTPEQNARLEALNAELQAALRDAFATGDPAGERAQHAADLHRQWLQFFWPEGMYSADAHKGLAQMYVDDERFRAYYDAEQPGMAAFLRDAIEVYAGGK